MRLRVLSYNIHKGFAVGGTRFVLNEIRSAIRAVGPDVVFLQEVQGHHERKSKKVKRWPSESQFEFLADAVWPHFAYGRNAIYEEGHHGNAILSRHPFVAWENIDISVYRLERRGLLHGTIRPLKSGRKVHLLCVHLDLFEPNRKKQLATITERIRERVPDGDPVVLAGDFNDWRDGATGPLESEAGLEEVFCKRYGKLARTFPSWMPVLRLDRIYARGLEVYDAWIPPEGPWSELSDHVPIAAEVGLRSKR